MSRVQGLETETKILQEVAATFPPDSPQYAAVRKASYALIFAISQSYEAFSNFMASRNEALSDEQREHLREQGLEENS